MCKSSFYGLCPIAIDASIVSSITVPREPPLSLPNILMDSKYLKYTIAQINNYPTTTYAVQIITNAMYAWASDLIFNEDSLPPIIFGTVR